MDPRPPSPEGQTANPAAATPPPTSSNAAPAPQTVPSTPLPTNPVQTPSPAVPLNNTTPVAAPLPTTPTLIDIQQPVSARVVTSETFVPDAGPPMDFQNESGSKLRIVALIIGLVLALGGGIATAVVLYQKHNNSTSTTVASCGKATITNATFGTSPYKGCFDQHFTACTPAEITVDNESDFLKGTINQYDIQSKQGALCMVQWQYVALPSNPKWNGKTVTCGYDNTKDFKTALGAKSDFNGCTGPLLSLVSPSSSSGSTVTTSPGTTVIH